MQFARAQHDGLVLDAGLQAVKNALQAEYGVSDTVDMYCIIHLHFNPLYDSGTKGSLRLEEVADLGRNGSHPWGSFPGDALGQTLFIARELEEKDQHATLATAMKAAYLQALMDDRFQSYTPCNGDIATMTDTRRRVQAGCCERCYKGDKREAGRKCQETRTIRRRWLCARLQKRNQRSTWLGRRNIPYACQITNRWGRQYFRRCGRMR